MGLRRTCSLHNRQVPRVKDRLERLQRGMQSEKTVEIDDVAFRDGKLYVAESREQAWNDVEPHLHYLFTSAFPLLKEAGDLRRDRAMSAPPPLSELRTIDPTFPGGFPIIGTAEDCIRVIERYKTETRVTHLALGMHLPGLAPAKLRQSLTRFARDVMPHFQ